MAQTKTNNSFLADKVKLRANHLPESERLRVMDCYSGSGAIWQAVKELTGRKIITLPIDTQDYGNFYLPGDNIGYLETMDLSRFDVIDLDAYGVPYAQLKTIFQRGYAGTIFVTFIQSVMGSIPNGLLNDVGLSTAMVEKIPTLFAKRGWDYFIQFLAQNGVSRIWHREHDRKHYAGFVLCGIPGGTN